MTRSTRWSVAILSAALAAVVTCESAAPDLDLKTLYEKREVMIPMRDGVELFTIVYAPRDRSRAYPILLTRTAYGIPPYEPDTYRAVIGPNNDFAREGYIVVYQDVRGKFRSQGQFIHHSPIVEGSAKPNESTDTWDTIDWLLRHVPGHNGRVGQWGISWAGWQVSMGMIGAHPALKASSPQAPPQDQFLGDDHHSGGAFQLMYAFGWMSQNARARNAPTDQPVGRFDYGTPDGYRFFLDLGAAANASMLFADQVPTWNDYMAHGTYDEYWQSRNVPKDLEGISHPVLIVASWFDAQDFRGPFRMYRAIEEKNPGNRSTLVVGPWLHGGWARMDGDTLGDISFGQKTGEYFRREVELPFFNHYLKDEGELRLPEVLAFHTGANRWESHDRWPPAGTQLKELYLRPGRVLSFEAPPGGGAAGTGEAPETEYEEYVSDPSRPVPSSAEITTTEGHLFMVEDQRFAWTRPDVLVYETGVLAEDVTVAGEIEADLRVSTTGTDGDWVVKLIDVYPGDAPDPDPNPRRVRMGEYQLMIAGDILRAKFRHDPSRPEPMVPGHVTRLRFSLGDKYHTFKKGHRLMVHVQSSWFPMFDRNPQTFVDIYHARPADYRTATHRLYLGAGHSSSLRLPVLAAR